MKPYDPERWFHVYHVYYHTDVFGDRPRLTQKFTVEARDAEQAEILVLKKLHFMFGVSHVSIDKVVMVS